MMASRLTIVARVGSVLVLCGMAMSTAAALAVNMTMTPLGLRPSHCVHSHPSGSVVEPVEGGVVVHFPNATRHFFPEHADCVENMAKVLAARRDRQRAAQGHSGTRGMQAQYGPSQWVDNAGYFLPVGTALRNFTAQYIMPSGNPQTSSADTWLYVAPKMMRW